MQRRYTARRASLPAGIDRWFGDHLVTIGSVAGLHVSARTTNDPAAWVQRARSEGLAVYSIAETSQNPAAPRGLVFGFGEIGADRIDEALQLLATLR